MLFSEQMQEAIECLNVEDTIRVMCKHITRDNRIAWLKAVRTKYDLGLKDAKELTDLMIESPRASWDAMEMKLEEGIRNGEHRRSIVAQYNPCTEEPTESSKRTWFFHKSSIDALLGALEGVDPITLDELIQNLRRAKESGFTVIQMEAGVK